jgi:hypothetical protein
MKMSSAELLGVVVVGFEVIEGVDIVEVVVVVLELVSLVKQLRSGSTVTASFSCLKVVILLQLSSRQTAAI